MTQPWAFYAMLCQICFFLNTKTRMYLSVSPRLRVDKSISTIRKILSGHQRSGGADSPEG
jgi:hypothetical protein